MASATYNLSIKEIYEILEFWRDLGGEASLLWEGNEPVLSLIYRPAPLEERIMIYRLHSEEFIDFQTNERKSISVEDIKKELLNVMIKWKFEVSL